MKAADETGCNCRTREEHDALVRRVDESYLRDGERARERAARTAGAIRLRALSAGNGHTR